jgi:hypothetical protein
MRASTHADSRHGVHGIVTQGWRAPGRYERLQAIAREMMRDAGRILEAPSLCKPYARRCGWREQSRRAGTVARNRCPRGLRLRALHHQAILLACSFASRRCACRSPWLASCAVCTDVSVASAKAARAALLMLTEYEAEGADADVVVLLCELDGPAGCVALAACCCVLAFVDSGVLPPLEIA